MDQCSTGSTPADSPADPAMVGVSGAGVPAPAVGTRPPVPGQGQACAYWVDEHLLAWPASMLPPGVRRSECVGPSGGRPAVPPPVSFGLVCAPDGGARLSAGILQRGQRGVEVPLGVVGELDAVAPAAVASHPQLAGYLALTTQDEFGAPRLVREDVEDLLTGQVCVVQRSAVGAEHITPPGADPLSAAEGWVTAFTGVQTWPLIDRIWGHQAAARDGSAPLGAVFDPAAHHHLSFALWAPTARSVTLLTWDTGEVTGTAPLVTGQDARRTPATRLGDGRWCVPGAVVDAEGIQEGCQYQWEVEVYVPTTGRVERNVVTDPYARALTTDSVRAVAVDVQRRELRPSLWRSTLPPVVTEDAARVVYEVHLRDLTAADTTLEPSLRGTYAALTHDCAATRHLRALAGAGVDTIHLLPIFDFSTVPEERSAQSEPTIPQGGPASPAQQEALGQVRETDAYNWGYDPWHWMVPEGSYATPAHQDGGARVAQVREMVGAIHAMGLQVVLDQVYNHTAAAGQAPTSLLDRIVPGYYHRLDAAGAIETSACGTNVATERAMAERILIDSCVSWVCDYRVDGFRFDLMGYHSTTTMRRLKEALAQVAPDAIGHEVYLYGEGWNMGEVAGNRLFRQAVQGQVGQRDGLGIATFNDRVRDAVVGSQFGPDPRLGQGIGSGLAGAVNEREERTEADLGADLAWRTDVLRLALAGNVRGLTLPGRDGAWHSGEEVRYGDGAAAYGDEPADSLAYVCSHDDETLWDRLAYKLPVGVSMDERVRYSTLCLAAVTLGQSPAFWPAGVEMLRSKSLDRDSYDSGDWFNVIDLTGQDNGWGRGLPPAWRNFDRWLIQAALLAREDLRPGPEHIETAWRGALDLLRVRRSVPLLCLGSAALIRERVSFPVLRWADAAGWEGRPAHPDGVVVMVVDDGAGEADLDPALDGAMVVLNFRPQTARVVVDSVVGRDFRLCEAQREGYDPVVRAVRCDPGRGVVEVPALTAAVLVEH